MANYTRSVGTTASLLVAANPKRVGLVFDNDSAVDIYYGDSESVTADNGITLGAGEQKEFFHGGGAWQFYYRGDFYGIVSATTSDIRVLELIDTRE